MWATISELTLNQVIPYIDLYAQTFLNFFSLLLFTIVGDALCSFRLTFEFLIILSGIAIWQKFSIHQCVFLFLLPRTFIFSHFFVHIAKKLQTYDVPAITHICKACVDPQIDIKAYLTAIRVLHTKHSLNMNFKKMLIPKKIPSPSFFLFFCVYIYLLTNSYCHATFLIFVVLHVLKNYFIWKVLYELTKQYENDPICFEYDYLRDKEFSQLYGYCKKYDIVKELCTHNGRFIVQRTKTKTLSFLLTSKLPADVIKQVVEFDNFIEFEFTLSKKKKKTLLQKIMNMF